jgi:hypothetical protein
MASRATLVKYFIISQSIYYYLTHLAITFGALKFTNNIKRFFLLSAKETTIGANCKVN